MASNGNTIPTYHEWQPKERQSPGVLNGRSRISGYAGHVPGLLETVQVNTSEYAEWEFETRPKMDPPSPMHTLTKSMASPSHYPMSNSPIKQSPKHFGGSQDFGAKSPSQRKKATGVSYHLDPHPTFLSRTTAGTIGASPGRTIVPRTRIIGYNGHVPGIQETFGVINGEYQNHEYFDRKTKTHEQYANPGRHSQNAGPGSPSNLARQYHQRADEMIRSEHKTSGGSQRRSSSTPLARPTDYDGHQSLNDPVQTVAQYLEQDRATSFSGYVPRKKFTVGI